MQVSGFRSFPKARAAVLIAAASTACWVIPAAAQTAPAATAAPHAKLGAWGIDLAGRDMSVKPGVDFERYASGTWFAKTQIAPDKPEVSSFYDLFDLSQEELKDLVTNAPADSKYGTMYKSMMDEARVEALGLAPLKGDLDQIAAIKTKAAFARRMGGTLGTFGKSLIYYDVEPDTADASMNALYVYQSGLGMPNRDYYLKPEFNKQRGAYRAYVERTFKAIGNPNPAAAATRLLAFETAVAKV